VAKWIAGSGPLFQPYNRGGSVAFIVQREDVFGVDRGKVRKRPASPRWMFEAAFEDDVPGQELAQREELRPGRE